MKSHSDFPGSDIYSQKLTELLQIYALVSAGFVLAAL